MNEKNTSIVKARIVGAILLALFIVVLNVICTQFIAFRLGYPPAFGEPLFGRIYDPFDWWGWTYNFYRASPNIYNYAFIIFMLGVSLGMVTFVLVIGFKFRSSRKHFDVHGSAHFASFKEVLDTGLIPEQGKQGQGVYCGAFDDPKEGFTYYLRHDGPEHVCALAPTRSGKGVGLVVPTLLSWPHSVFVLDRKGENHAMTSGWRRKEADNVILRFDPAQPGESCGWNPLSEIRYRTRFQVSDTQNIALMVIDDDGKGISGDHFRTAAFELLVGIILHALYKGETKTIGRIPCLQDCAHMLTGVGDFSAPDTKDNSDNKAEGDPKALTGLFSEMRDVSFPSTDTADREAKLVIAGVGRRMLETPERELGSIISTANNALSLYRDPIVGENTAHSDFLVSDLMKHDKPVSLYFITTPRNADRMRPLARLLLTLIVSTLADRMEFDDGRSKTDHNHRLLLMLDEFPTLGKLDVFESALAFIAGYGMKAYLITQDVQQLYKTYSNYESIISNCHVRIAYAPNKVETAEWMSKMAGQTTVIKEKIDTSGKRFGMVLEQVNRSYDEVHRPLMTADEIMQLPGPKKDIRGDIIEPGEMLVFVAGHPVIRGRQILYFRDPIFTIRSKIVPPERTDVVRSNPIKKASHVDEQQQDVDQNTKMFEIPEP